MIYGRTDELIKENMKKKLPWENYSEEVWNIAMRYKKICMENLYTWKNMDRDLLQEAHRIKSNGSRR